MEIINSNNNDSYNYYYLTKTRRCCNYRVQRRKNLKYGKFSYSNSVEHLPMKDPISEKKILAIASKLAILCILKKTKVPNVYLYTINLSKRETHLLYAIATHF